jgi:ABC-type transport system substrate-binding protein
VLAVVILTLACTGCRGRSGPPTRRAPGQPNVLRIAAQMDPSSLDPAIAYDTVSWTYVRLIYAGLLDYDDGVNLVPSIAESLPAISPDGCIYTYRLKKGIRFSNGREVRAEDFVYAIERVLDPRTKSPGEGFFRNIVGARDFQGAREKERKQAGPEGPRERRIEPTRVRGLSAPDHSTLCIRLEKPDLAFLNVSAMPFAYPVPREAVEQYGDDFFCHPVGAGPYVLTRWDRGKRLRLDRNPRYNLAPPPPLSGVETMIGGDSLVHQMMFERGELDATGDIPAPDFVRITTDPRWKPYLVTALINRTVYLPMNCEMKPFTDVRVRRAMNYAVDKARILQTINGRGVPAKGVLPPQMPGYNPNLRGYGYDPAKARLLLAQAGYPDGLQAPFWVRSDVGFELRVAQALQQDLAEVGVQLELKPVSFATVIEVMGKRKAAEFGIFGWSQDYPDPSNFLDVLLNGNRITDTMCNNAAFYSNPRVNALLGRANRETDRALRLRLYQEAEQLIVDDAPWVFLYYPISYALRQPWVKGFALHPVWPVRYEKISFDGQGLGGGGAP